MIEAQYSDEDLQLKIEQTKKDMKAGVCDPEQGEAIIGLSAALLAARDLQAAAKRGDFILNQSTEKFLADDCPRH